jgi:hypothetical protein
MGAIRVVEQRKDLAVLNTIERFCWSSPAQLAHR